MRTLEQINRIKERIINPYVVNEFISYNDVRYLISLFESQKVEPNKVYKNTGPITLDIQPFIEDTIVKKILTRIQDEIGPYEITAGFFFWTNYPHIIHNDDTYELPDNVYRAVTIPLEIEGTATPSLCFFDQFYFHGPAKFFNGSTDIPTYYNKQVYDYQDVDGVLDKVVIDESTRVTYLTHLKHSWLKGLSLWGVLPWKPGTALIFDSNRLHCASDFRKQGIKSKLGISIFTKRK
jgi:hypothetical protein